jgi:dipeptidyl aminopeptidase/acylaminoacyl peptidase
MLALLETPGLAKAQSPASAPPIEAYGRLPAIADVSLSPAGDKMVSINQVNGKRYILLRTIAGDILLTIPVQDNKVRNILWVDNSHILVDVSKTGQWSFETDNSEFRSTYAIDADKKSSSILFGRNPKFPTFHYGLMATRVLNGKPYAFVANVPLEGVNTGSRLPSETNSYRTRWYPDLWKLDLADDSVTLAAAGSPGINAWVVAPDGTIAAFTNLDRQKAIWRLFHGQQLLMSKPSTRLETGLHGLGRTPNSVLVFDGSNGDRWLEVQLDGKTTVLSSGERLTRVFQSHSTGLLLGLETNDTDVSFYDPALQARATAALKPFLKSNGTRRVSIVSYTDDLSELVLHTGGDGDSGTYYLVNLATHRADIIDNDYPDVADRQVGSVRDVTYTASDGLALDGVLTLPPGAKAQNLPVVILPHGGPIGIVDQVGFDWMAQAFASRGYAVFQPNYRGSGGHGAAFRDAGFGEFGRKMLSDISDGLDALAKQGVVDRHRACIVGFSYGGYAAMAGVTVQQGLYRCAVAGSGLSDLPLMLTWVARRYGAPSASLSFWREAMGPTVPGAPSLKSISPVAYAARADAPILLIHGEDDSVVPLEQSQIMYSALKNAGKPVEYIQTKSEDHWLSREDTRVATLKAAVAFVEKYDPPN